jgi:dCMP deaminase
MASQKILDEMFMAMAKSCTLASKAVRKKVGCVVVKNGQVISNGFNGTPSGFDNTCEVNDVTKPEVLHAESNALMKLAQSTNSSTGSTMYLTCSPCFDCAKLIIQAGVERVVYEESYRKLDGLELLQRANIQIDKFHD